MAWAPSAVSSPGWNTAIKVPRQVVRAWANNVVAPTSQVTCMSWPHMWLTGVAAAVAIVGRRLAGVRQTGRFFDRQRVHVGAQHHRRSVAVSKQAHHAGLPDAGRHLVTCGAKMIRRQARRTRFMHRQLRVRVDILVEAFEVWQQTFQVRQRRVGRRYDRMPWMFLRASQA